ncbi:MAG: WD40 repeat domain-containing serine/threonine protein kinase [Planctomycetota bacterium]|jgi:serine/threonine-protein kinase|nr:WD40 repeat domain-containing serine/threonine protein kinase [Planctomycetota bacterium]
MTSPKNSSSSDAFDNLYQRLTIAKGWTDEEEVQLVLGYRQMRDSDSKAKSLDLGALLLEADLITPEQDKTVRQWIRAVIKRRKQILSSKKRPQSDADLLLVRKALSRGSIRKSDVLKALIQQATRDSATSLGRVLVEEKYLTADEFQDLYPSQPRPGAPDSPPQTPAQFGKYLIEGQLGSGGMGAVYQAREALSGRVVALKVIKQGQDRNPGILQRFEREAKILAEVDHPSVVPIFEFGSHEGYLYYTMPIVEGTSLRTILKTKAPLPSREVARILHPIANALSEVHGRGYIHRDLKPGNILLNPLGDSVLIDFGIARSIDQQTQLTHSGVRVGTPSYMAPEQILRSKSVDHRADLFSLGVIFYELVSGERPFRGQNPAETYYRITETTPPLLRKIDPGIDPAAEAIALRCLQKQADRRYPDARSLAEDLERHARGESTTARSPSPIHTLLQMLHRGGILLAASVVAALFLVSFTVKTFSQARVRKQQTVARVMDAQKGLSRAIRTKNWTKMLAFSAFLSDQPDGIPIAPQPLDQAQNISSGAWFRKHLESLSIAERLRTLAEVEASGISLPGISSLRSRSRLAVLTTPRGKDYLKLKTWPGGPTLLLPSRQPVKIPVGFDPFQFSYFGKNRHPAQGTFSAPPGSIQLRIDPPQIPTQDLPGTWNVQAEALALPSKIEFRIQRIAREERSYPDLGQAIQATKSQQSKHRLRQEKADEHRTQWREERIRFERHRRNRLNLWYQRAANLQQHQKQEIENLSKRLDRFNRIIEQARNELQAGSFSQGQSTLEQAIRILDPPLPLTPQSLRDHTECIQSLSHLGHRLVQSLTAHLGKQIEITVGNRKPVRRYLISCDLQNLRIGFRPPDLSQPSDSPSHQGIDHRWTDLDIHDLLQQRLPKKYRILKEPHGLYLDDDSGSVFSLREIRRSNRTGYEGSIISRTVLRDRNLIAMKGRAFSNQEWIRRGFFITSDHLLLSRDQLLSNKMFSHRGTALTPQEVQSRNLFVRDHQAYDQQDLAEKRLYGCEGRALTVAEIRSRGLYTEGRLAWTLQELASRDLVGREGKAMTRKYALKRNLILRGNRAWTPREIREKGLYVKRARWTGSHGTGITAIALAREASTVVTGGSGGTIEFRKATDQWRQVVASKQPDREDLLAFTVLKNNKTVLAWTPRGLTAYAAPDFEGRVRAFEFPELEGSNLVHARFANSGSRGLAASRDRIFIFSNLPSQPRIQKTIEEPNVELLALDPTGKNLATFGGTPKALRIWNSSSGKVRHVITSPQSIRALAFDPKGRRLFLVSRPKGIQVVSVASGRLTSFSESHPSSSLIAVRPDGKRIALAEEDGSISILDTQTGDTTWKLRGHNRAVEQLTFDSTGRWLLSTDDRHEAILWGE